MADICELLALLRTQLVHATYIGMRLPVTFSVLAAWIGAKGVNCMLSFFTGNLRPVSLWALVLVGWGAPSGSFLAAADGQASSASIGSGSNAVLVELFTSEGCSSCPPADALLADIASRQNIPGALVIPLSEHVDYWNQLGWRDPFSSGQNSRRQGGYSARFGLGDVYTPQIVVDGQQQMVGSQRFEVTNAIRQAIASPKLGLAISEATWQANVIHLRISVTGDVPRSGAGLYAALADDIDRSSVLRGENGGRTLDHVAVLRSMQMVATMNEPGIFTAELKVPFGASRTNLHVVVFAQMPGLGRVLGAVATSL